MEWQSQLKNFNSYFTKKIASLAFELYASLRNKRFFCRALKGDSSYNIVINSDLTVSCNCNDNYGLGRIGDFKNQSLEHIFSGEKARGFRKSLAGGKLPIVNCVVCPDLCFVDRREAERYIDDFGPPTSVMVENTVNCNLDCLSCHREKIYSLRSKREMSLEDIKKVSLEIKQSKIKRISYFNLGEPFLSKEIKKELEIIKEDNPDAVVIISTNGIVLDSEEKRKAALLADKIIFSIHGSTQGSLTRYQKRGDFDKTYSNMKSLVMFRELLKRKKPEIIWKYLLFRWNDSDKLILDAIKLAKEAGIDQIYFEKTLSPLLGISYKYYFGWGYLNKTAKFNGKICRIPLNNKESVELK
ncbi:MAG: radical SAM protein [Candidatus Omnitrophota bacterium]